MASPKLSSFQKQYRRPVLPKTSSLIVDALLFSGGASLALSLVWSLLSAVNQITSFGPAYDLAAPTFYDDPSISYSIREPVVDWDAKRTEWLKRHPSFAASAGDQVLLVTGSQPSVCSNPSGDHLQLRFFKNKVDYCRIHGCDIFYNNALLHPKYDGAWAKYPLLRAAMLAHPEADWIWWVDSDAIFTDMEFKLPLERYRDHNLVVAGRWHLIFKKQSWKSLDAGVFLIRNCQWSMDLIEEWTSMGPQSPDYERWGRIQKSMFKDKLVPHSDDQSALIYLLIEQKEKWADKTYLESEYNLSGKWLEIVDGLEDISKRYTTIDREVKLLRRRHAEKVSPFYGKMRDQYLEDKGNWKNKHRRPFVTHFTGCEPCTGKPNPAYTWQACWNGMQKTLNFADTQVIRSFGFVHPDLLDAAKVSPVPIASQA